jgi:type IV pilus assembly protein PilY1
VNASPLPGPVLSPAPAPIATKITTLLDGSGRAQPITSRPIPSIIGTDYVLYIGTGRYLGTPDLTDQGAGASAWQQSYYAFKDKAYSSGVQANLRTDTTLVQRTFTKISPTERGISTSPLVTMNWNTNDGWFIDFNPVFSSVQDSPGEGVNLVDPRLINGTIFVTTNVPANTAGGAVCAVGGSSFQYQFDFKSGLPISTSPNGAVGWANQKTITVGVAVVQLPNGAIKAITTGADTTKTTSSVNPNASGTLVKRFSYRVR